MVIQFTNERIFWNTIGDNKPSKEYLDALEKRMQVVELHVNQDDFMNLTIVSKNKDITYIITNINNFKQYWFFNGIEKILPNGYVLKFQLDIFATYTLRYFNHLKDNNVLVKINRSHKFNYETMFFNDELMDNIPIIHTHYIDEPIQTAEREEYAPNKYKLYINKSDNSYIDIDTIGAASSSLICSGNYYYVFEIVSSGRIVLFPLIYDDTRFQGGGLFRMSYVLSGYQIDSPVSAFINNTLTGLEKLKNSALYSNKFIGCFLFQNFYTFKNGKPYYDIYTYTKSGDELDGYKYACLTIDIKGVETRNNPLLISNTIKAINYNEQIPSFNYDEKLHQYALKYMDFQYFGQKINASLLYNNNEISINHYLINFTQSGFMKILIDDTNYEGGIYDWGDGVLSFPADLPSWKDTYINYLNATKNQRDNQLNILKQQYDKGIVSGVFNGIFGLTNSVKNADVIGGLSTIFNSGLGLANVIQGYDNAKNTIKAQLEDTRNVMGQQVNAGNIDDAIKGYFNHMIFGIPSYVIRHKKLTNSTIKALNNVIYLYGANNPQIDTLTNFTIRNDFNYYLFDEMYLRQITPFNIEPNTPPELIPYIQQQLSQGVRLWNILPSN